MARATPPLYAELVEPGPLFAELVEDPPPAEPAPEIRTGFFHSIRMAAGWCFGLVSLVFGLSVLAAIPLGQFLALGYLLESGGRVARSGRLRDGFIGIRFAAKCGGIALALFLMWLPLYYLSIQAEAARIIDPHGRIARQWDGWLAAIVTLATLHATGAILRDGRFRSFFWPMNIPWLIRNLIRGGLVTQTRDRLWDTAVSLRLPYYFWLGLRGFLGAFLWLALPLTLLGQGHRAPIVGFLGGCLLALVVLYVPFLQVRFARDNRLRVFRQLGPIREAFRGAPLAFTFALWAHLLLAIPLYIMKIEVIPRELGFLEGMAFLSLMFPARLLGGWAYARGVKRPTPRFWMVRWFSRFAAFPIVVAYVLVVFLSQHLGWQGIGSLYEQHAFLLPVPFVTWQN